MLHLRYPVFILNFFLCCFFSHVRKYLIIGIFTDQVDIVTANSFQNFSSKNIQLYQSKPRWRALVNTSDTSPRSIRPAASHIQLFIYLFVINPNELWPELWREMSYQRVALCDATTMTGELLW